MIGEVFAKIIQRNRERYVRSVAAVSQFNFSDLGIADAAILLCCNKRYELLTADLGLHLAAQALGIASTNFNHIREDYGRL